MVRPRTWRRGFTLLELVVVIAILAVLAGILLLNVGTFQDKASLVTTQTTLGAVRDAIVGKPDGIAYQPDMRSFSTTQPSTLGLPATLQGLYAAPIGAPVYNPVTRLGWRGPYLKGDTGVYQVNTALGFTADYGTSGDSAPVDAWNHSIVIQIPVSDPTYARLVSAGPDGVIQTPLNYVDSRGRPYPPQSMRGDDVVLFLLRADVPPAP